MTSLLWLLGIVAAADMVLLIVLLVRSLRDPVAPLGQRLDALERLQERLQERTERALGTELARNRDEATAVGRGLRAEVTASLGTLGEATGRQLETMRRTVEDRLAALQADNAQKLDRMRQVVDEQLQGTLERRLGESFKLVSDRLEQVHKGLGEMQTLASGVGDLKKVLSNVKTRGTWGEIQLGNILEDCFSPNQYAANVATRGEGGERVEFAIRLPGRGDDGGRAGRGVADADVVWLPIDAKFPLEDYERLITAQEAGDLTGMEAAARQLEVRIRNAAHDICVKYVAPPATTDFGIMFLPTEGLYAEVLRRPGLVEAIRHDHHVIVAGPTTLMALLNSLQMGFRTLAIQQRSSEVWNVLSSVKTEFERFGGVLDKLKKKLQEASNVVEKASTRSRVLQRKLKDVQALPAREGEEALALPEGVAAEGTDRLALSDGAEAPAPPEEVAAEGVGRLALSDGAGAGEPGFAEGPAEPIPAPALPPAVAAPRDAAIASPDAWRLPL
jgi:DNA recombination protein RmuC